MKRIPAILCLGIALLFASQADAQTPRTIVNWCVETPYGLIGYRAITFGGPISHYVQLGPCGAIVLSTPIVAGLIAVALLIAGAAGLWFGIRRRRATVASTQKNTTDVSVAVGRRSAT